MGREHGCFSLDRLSLVDTDSQRQDRVVSSWSRPVNHDSFTYVSQPVRRFASRDHHLKFLNSASAKNPDKGDWKQTRGQVPL
jgi:hypothetical protein